MNTQLISVMVMFILQSSLIERCLSTLSKCVRFKYYDNVDIIYLEKTLIAKQTLNLRTSSFSILRASWETTA